MKTKILKQFFVVLVISLSLANCETEYLETTPTQYISVSDLKKSSEKNPSLSASLLEGIYTKMFEEGTGGTTKHEDFGQKAMDIFSDLLTADMSLGANIYNRYGGLVQLEATVDYTTLECYIPWRYYYRLIRSSNLLIKSLGGNDVTPEGDNGYSMGQAKALRAYCYFYLSQLYSNEGYNPANSVLPLYNNPDDPALAQSTNEQVYNQIISDLTTAITLLDGFDRGANRHQINQDVAKGLLAYVYASMNTNTGYQEALKLANEVMANFPLTTSDEATGGFNSVSESPSWIWGVDITLDHGLDLISWWGQVDIYTYSYAWAGELKVINKELYDAIKSTDVRKSQFHSSMLIPSNKFYNDNKKIGGQRNIEDDYVYMRVDEMCLLSAEMSAKLGDDATAKTTLKKLLAKRFSNATEYAYIDGLSGQALQDEIYTQTRIELWGEGKSYLAMKRNKATITLGSNHIFFANEAIPYNDDRLTFDIPEAEILNNPNIDK